MPWLIAKHPITPRYVPFFPGWSHSFPVEDKSVRLVIQLIFRSLIFLDRSTSALSSSKGGLFHSDNDTKFAGSLGQWGISKTFSRRHWGRRDSTDRRNRKQRSGLSNGPGQTGLLSLHINEDGQPTTSRETCLRLPLSLASLTYGPTDRH